MNWRNTAEEEERLIANSAEHLREHDEALTRRDQREVEHLEAMLAHELRPVSAHVIKCLQF
jgi:hypothetical protein